jgi:HAE1 family hydrophobic/amphiphilic exporter-1
MGLNMAQIATTLRTYFHGDIASRYTERGEEYDIVVKLKEEDKQKLMDVKNIVLSPPSLQLPVAIPRIPTWSGTLLGNIAKIVEKRGPLEIERKQQGRVVKVGAGLYERSLGDVVKDIKRELRKIVIPEGVDVILGGAAQEQAEAFKVLFIAMLLSVLLVYMIMASQFESLVDPFVVIFSVPFAVTGVIWALLITGFTLSIISFVGMIMLVGIVTRNAIVLVDYANILRRRGMELTEAVKIAGAVRLRPVLMTALTTVLAMIPLAVRKAEGAEFWNPLGVSVIGGLMVSTLVTLILVPTLYTIAEGKRFK